MPKAAPLVAVGLDSGTQGTKALIIDFEHARVVGRGFAPHASRPGLKPGESEQDPETWVTAMTAAHETALRESKANPSRSSPSTLPSGAVLATFDLRDHLNF